MRLALAGCAGSGNVQDDCERLVAEAAAVDATSDTVEDLDEAIATCATLDELAVAAELHPDALDGVDMRTFVSNRCSFNESLADAAICQELGE